MLKFFFVVMILMVNQVMAQTGNQFPPPVDTTTDVQCHYTPQGRQTKIVRGHMDLVLLKLTLHDELMTLGCDVTLHEKYTTHPRTGTVQMIRGVCRPQE